jgi:regulator of protease activity HflC (stomatin/prohibitin superfamily)
MIGTALLYGFILYIIVRVILSGFYIVDQNERAVKTSFGKAQRLDENLTTLNDAPLVEPLTEEERERYAYPQMRVIKPGGPYFKMPWQKVHKVSVATRTVNVAYDPQSVSANNNGTMLDAVTKDQLNTGLKGQLRYAVSERNLYAYIFGVKNPIAHIMGYFISILRERIANFEAPKGALRGQDALSQAVHAISINDLRKNLSDLNRHMERECRSSTARYGMELDAVLITSIEPPAEVESALAAINTAHNHVSSEISLAQAAADQKIVQSKRAVEIETLKALAEVETLKQMAEQLVILKKKGAAVLPSYLRYVRLGLLSEARRFFLEFKK